MVYPTRERRVALIFIPYRLNWGTITIKPLELIEKDISLGDMSHRAKFDGGLDMINCIGDCTSYTSPSDKLPNIVSSDGFRNVKQKQTMIPVLPLLLCDFPFYRITYISWFVNNKRRKNSYYDEKEFINKHTIIILVLCLEQRKYIGKRSQNNAWSEQIGSTFLLEPTILLVKLTK